MAITPAVGGRQVAVNSKLIGCKTTITDITPWLIHITEIFTKETGASAIIILLIIYDDRDLPALGSVDLCGE